MSLDFVYDEKVNVWTAPCACQMRITTMDGLLTRRAINTCDQHGKEAR